MSDAPKLTVPEFRVVPADGAVPYTVQATNADLVAYDVTAYRHKWPPFQKAPMLWGTFLAWHASRRLAVIGPEVTFESFRDTTLEVSATDDDAVTVPPTREDPDTDY